MEYKELYKHMVDENEKILEARYERYLKMNVIDILKEISWVNPLRREPELTDEGRNALLMTLLKLHENEIKEIALKLLMNKEVENLLR
jgi:hypothetical protein